MYIKYNGVEKNCDFLKKFNTTSVVAYIYNWDKILTKLRTT